MDITINSKKEEIAERLHSIINESEKSDKTVHGYQINYLSTFLLVKEQNEFNKRMLFWSRLLAIATWVLAIATIILVSVTK